MEPTDHGLLKLNGPEDDVCNLLMAVAKGGFCWLRCAVKKLTWS